MTSLSIVLLVLFSERFNQLIKEKKYADLRFLICFKHYNPLLVLYTPTQSGISKYVLNIQILFAQSINNKRNEYQTFYRTISIFNFIQIIDLKGHLHHQHFIALLFVFVHIYIGLVGGGNIKRGALRRLKEKAFSLKATLGQIENS